MSNAVIRNDNGEFQELLDLYYRYMERIQEEYDNPPRREGDLASFRMENS